MKRQITGLNAADRCAADQVPDGVFLVRVQKAYFRRQAQKPYHTVTLNILEPCRFADHIVSSRLYCKPSRGRLSTSSCTRARCQSLIARLRQQP